MKNTRRIFMMTLAAAGTSLSAIAQGQPRLSEKDPQAAGLGYVEDATKTDTKKFPKYASGQLCNNCVLYQGKASDALAGCAIFAGKQVVGKGWCNAWAKKAG